MKTLKKGVARWMLGLCAGVFPFLSPLPVQAQTATPSPVPQHWISYAELTGNQFAVWLSDPADEAVVQLHSMLQDRVLKEGKPPLQPLVARVWISPMGMVTRLDVPSTGDAKIDEALRKLLMTRTLPEPPPADMHQPMVLQLSLDFPGAGGST